MKHYLLYLNFILIFFGCTKEEEVKPQTPEELLKGNWYITNEKREFYDSTNIKVHEHMGLTVIGELEVTNKNLYVNHTTGSFDSGTYSFSENDGKRFITISQNNTLTQQFRIQLVTKSSMTWVREIPNEYYYDGSGMRPAAKTMFYNEFTRK